MKQQQVSKRKMAYWLFSHSEKVPDTLNEIVDQIEATFGKGYKFSFDDTLELYRAAIIVWENTK
jgi:hypothetical protein